MPLDLFEKILDEIVPEYGTPPVNLEESGEPTLVSSLSDYITAVKSGDLSCLMFCNGTNLNGTLMREVINAGIDIIRISMIDYNKEKYLKWMGVKYWYGVTIPMQRSAI